MVYHFVAHNLDEYYRRRCKTLMNIYGCKTKKQLFEKLVEVNEEKLNNAYKSFA